MKEDWNSKPHVFACNATWTGVYPGSVEKTSQSKWNDSRYAHCNAYFKIVTGIPGANATLNKKMHTWGDKWGNIRGEFANS